MRENDLEEVVNVDQLVERSVCVYFLEIGAIFAS